MPRPAPTEASVSDYDDASARQRIGPWTDEGVPDLSAFEPDTNFFVRAAAGSGKTTALVARMVGLVRTGVDPEDMAAITFTRNAAGEMSTRFYEELRRAQAALPSGTEQRARVTTALQNAERTFIGTVHAFCARLLRERPLAANLPPGFRAGLEDRERRQLRERAWQRYLRRVRDTHPERIEALTELGVEPDDLEAYFERLCEHPELDPYVNAPAQRPDLSEAVAEARRRLETWQEHRPEKETDGRDAVQRAFDKAEKMLAYRPVKAPAQKASFLELFADVSDEESAEVTLKCWGERGSSSYEWARSLRDERLPALVRDVVQPALRHWNAYVHREVVTFVQPAVEVFAELRREEGSLTFHDLLVHTRNLLRDHPTLRTAIQERYPHLLVDEFQDTDPLQAEILFYLASSDSTETEWTECPLRPGSLFIVGDDKQSIYRFRRADMAVFESVGALIEEKGGEAVTLTKNFRSVPALCNWCDEAFGAIFGNQHLADIQARYTPFDPQRAEGGAETGLRRLDIGKVPWNRGKEIAERDAERIARFIRAALDGRLDERVYADESEPEALFPGGADYSDFLVLTRTKSRLSVYAAALAERGIPYTITGSEDLGDAAEVKAIVDLLTCALRPDDEVACIAYLKGPLVGASDDDLYRYAAAGGSFGRMHEPVSGSVLDALPEETRIRFAEAFGRLRRIRRLLREERPSVAVERMVDELGLLAGAAHPPDSSEGSLRAGYVLRTITYVQDLTAQGLGWAEVLEELQRIVDGEEEVDGMTLETGSEDAVRVMNLHQAKGLEAPVVFLADPYSSGGDPPVKRHLRRESGEIVAPIVQGSGYYQRVTHPPLGWEASEDGAEGFRALERRHEEAEERRLLYVGATRAQKLLVVSTYPEKPEDGYWAPLYPHLDEAGGGELDVPEVGDSEVRLEAPAPRLQAQKNERRRRIEALEQPSFHTESVTAEKTDQPAEPLPSDSEGYGEAFGNALHALLEQCVRRRFGEPSLSRSVLRTVLEENGAEGTAAQIGRAETMVDRFFESRIWTALLEADRAYTEYPIARTSTESAIPVVERGVIDLAYRTNRRWTLVDYKSDRVEGPVDELLRGTHPYVQQIHSYAESWEEVVGEPVRRAGLWFADAGRYVPVISS